MYNQMNVWMGDLIIERGMGRIEEQQTWIHKIGCLALLFAWIPFLVHPLHIHFLIDKLKWRVMA